MNRIKVVYYYQKPRTLKNFSIEAYFKRVQHNMPHFIHDEAAVCGRVSNGLWPRIYNTLEAAFRQGDVNHITGDVHYIALLLKKRKTILTIHDCGFMNNKGAIARMVLRMFWLRLPIARSRYITVPTQATKEEVLKYVKVNPDKIHIIHHAIPVGFEPSPAKQIVEKPTVLHLGTAPNKNLPRLIEALEGVYCRLVVIGNLTAVDKALLQKHGLDYINHYNLTNEEVIRQYQDCDLLAFVSTYEGFGNPILEAQSIGRPLVTSKVSCLPDVAGEGACLVDPYDVASIRAGIVKVLEDPGYREKLVELGFINVQRFSMAKTIEQYVALYKTIANNVT
ncbi:glycosyltransferase family 1 protein [Segetibacter sp. 3557_3]|uniref:glycosyltransferase family 4 protein n=1 Tax=Segetibacter sp. 3557_3 TaxID=2547429 RepID=UPI001058E689|nr:glycosyltransferase family 1 protein [Segetibacter sp. 3557_3]TDH21428.1 glycosyltransferase family 1 protein [Segetibacter sp. 3557_3]